MFGNLLQLLLGRIGLLGTFFLGQNPATGAKIKIPASKRPAFVASKALKDAING